MLEPHGIHRTPNIALAPNEYYNQPQYNYQPRKDLLISLDLSCFKLIEPLLLENELSDSFRQMIMAAGKFYNRALNIYPTDPELAFLDLITAEKLFLILMKNNTLIINFMMISYFQILIGFLP